eukprot:Hpha_TRINITY_DN15766_c4_g16::TRINITY_DN15766_c4_g16_i1::g.36376::m.36376
MGNVSSCGGTDRGAVEVRSVAASGSGHGVYETARAVDEYLQFHYAGRDQFPYGFGPTDGLDFAQRLAAECIKNSLGHRQRSALDVGCAVGGSSFALAGTFDKVVGVDFSHAFINAAREMQKTGERRYTSLVRGDVFEPRVAEVRESEEIRERCDFRQGDACNLGDIGTFDCVLAGNLLCRLPKPRAFLDKVIEIVNPGGIFVIASPYSWLPEYTPKKDWMGGQRGADGEMVDSFGEVEKVLSQHFDLESREDVGFLLREHVRKFQWGVSDLSVWRRHATE